MKLTIFQSAMVGCNLVDERDVQTVFEAINVIAGFGVDGDYIHVGPMVMNADKPVSLWLEGPDGLGRPHVGVLYTEVAAVDLKAFVDLRVGHAIPDWDAAERDARQNNTEIKAVRA